MKTFLYNSTNVGDTLTQVVLDHFKIPYEKANKADTGKFLGIGSIIGFAKENDVIWTSGLICDTKINLKNVKVLAVRGKLTEANLNLNVGIYRDGALLLPLIYSPKVVKKYKIGIVEHYVDEGLYKGQGYKINVKLPWKEFINEVLSCEKIISSSLHGCILAEAYGIPCEWIVLSDKVIGNGFKFRDYLSGTGRTSFSEKLTKNKLREIQDKLIKVLLDWRDENSRSLR